MVFGAFILSACSSVQLATDKIGELTLGALGISAPEKPNVQLPPRSIAIKLEAGNDLNAGDDGKGLSVILRMYKLKSQLAFLSAPYSVFGNAEQEKETMGDTIIETKEIIMSPGQVIDLNENVVREAGYVGVVALFRSPSQQRWRFAFPSSDASSSGITVGVHRCALTATSTPPVGMDLSESRLLSSAKCQRL